MLSGSRALVTDFPTLLPKPCCSELPLSHTPYYCHQYPIPVLSRPAPLLLCPAPAVTREKHCIFFTSSMVLVCRLACLLNITLKMVQKTWFPASGFVWS